MPTIGQLQAEISEAIIKFEKEYIGRGPSEAKTYIVDDLVIVLLKGVLTQAEHQLAKTGETSKGRDLIKQLRTELLERGRPLLEAVIESITGKKVQSLHTDISTSSGERLIVFKLKGPPDFDS